MPTEELKEAVEVVGGQSALAREIGGSVKQAHVWWWLKRGKPDEMPPSRHVLAIEAATIKFGKKVSRHKLRPDVYGPAKEATKLPRRGRSHHLRTRNYGKASRLR